MNTIIMFKLKLINSENYNTEKKILEKINLVNMKYLQENAPILFFEISINLSLINFFDDKMEETVTLLLQSFNFLQIFKKFKKK